MFFTFIKKYPAKKSNMIKSARFKNRCLVISNHITVQLKWADRKILHVISTSYNNIRIIIYKNWI